MITYIFVQLKAPIILCPQEVASIVTPVSSPATFFGLYNKR